MSERSMVKFVEQEQPTTLTNGSAIKAAIQKWFLHASRTYLAFCIFVAPWYVIIYISENLGIGNRSTQVLSLLFLISAFLIAGVKVAIDLYHLLGISIKKFTPPYSRPYVEFNLSKSEGTMGRIEKDSIYNLALRFGLIYMVLATAWLIVIFICIKLLGPVDYIVRTIIEAVPGFISTTIFRTIANQTGIHLTTVVEGIGNPIGYGSLLLVLGPTFVFATFASWNFMYAIRELIPE